MKNIMDIFFGIGQACVVVTIGAVLIGITGYALKFAISAFE